MVEFQIGNVHHMHYDAHYLYEMRPIIINHRFANKNCGPYALDYFCPIGEATNDRFSNWKCGPPVYGSSYWNWNGRWGNPPPGRRAGPAGCPTTAMAGTCCTFTDIHTHSWYPNEFSSQTQIVIFWGKRVVPRNVAILRSTHVQNITLANTNKSDDAMETQSEMQLALENQVEKQ